VLTAGGVAVPRAPPAAGPFLNAGQGSSDAEPMGLLSRLLLATLLADEPPYVTDGGDEVAADLEELRADPALAPPAHGVDRHPQDLSYLGQCQQFFGVPFGERDVLGGDGHDFLRVVGEFHTQEQQPRDDFGHSAENR
jgi:hypothetical protein